MRVLRELEANPAVSQRRLAEQLGISLGKANAVIKALVDRGWVAATEWRGDDNRTRYVYRVTPKGRRRKARLVERSLSSKRDALKALTDEIDALVGELAPQRD